MSDDRFLSLERLTLGYGRTIIVDGIDLSVARGELIALLGPSGCGKTTTMRSIAGLLAPTAGRITLDGRDITRIPANKRNVGLVFQSYALFPHLTVFDNVAFGLRLRGVGAAEIGRRVGAALSGVGLDDHAARRPTELSGGQQQRAALARSMVVEPSLLLLDEPLSSLDARLRLEMRAELRRLQRGAGVTMIYVTHDQAEALALADRVVVMRGGAIEQMGPPEEIYERPRSAFVARFMGFENCFAFTAGRLIADRGSLPFAGSVPGAVRGLAWRPRGVVLGNGPHSGVVVGLSYLGQSVEYLIDTALGPIKAETEAAGDRFPPGTSIAFDLPAASGVWLENAE